MQESNVKSAQLDRFISNQRSVIAKIGNHQPSIELVNQENCDSQILREVQPAPSPCSTEYSSGELSSSPPMFMKNDSTFNESILLTNSNYTNYDLYYGYDLLKSKRKPIPVPSESKDDAYWERRRRNNESAKRSREIRRLKEMQTNKKITYLEQENVKLQAENHFLREELERLRRNEIFPYLVHRPK
ncbi:hypothetical protein RDWZM_002199 [Blomia tropicalis]|uniref:BZIP domain-containing protein n=1 Tax=Blomia tropicalis TaxID=40697 RepID=A0A9Q0MDW8_BLOTA|nr:hypothetical protein RDWZM_002199 [Blomia tropicalis]